MNQREKVLHLLEQSDNGVTTSDFLNAHLPRFSARIKELRDAGMVIETERLSASASRYTLRRSRGEGMLGGSETASRADSGGRVRHQEASQRQPLAVSSGPAAAGFKGQPSPPSLFDAEPVGPRSHYMEEV